MRPLGCLPVPIVFQSTNDFSDFFDYLKYDFEIFNGSVNCHS